MPFLHVLGFSRWIFHVKSVPPSPSRMSAPHHADPTLLSFSWATNSKTPSGTQTSHRQVPSVSQRQNQERVTVSGLQHFPSPGWSFSSHRLVPSGGPASSRARAAVTDLLMMSFVLFPNHVISGPGPLSLSLWKLYPRPVPWGWHDLPGNALNLSMLEQWQG